ncbi:hypothetical protein [Streptomyces sp. PH10-H1]|uniref:hypothetical protein n=1 Tax=Streptomyces sp. PH10-H1 TaxID=3046212 RepID=UPI0024B911D5|nr:hypothetical protein [Streptomyces sp. PH10-H1]MDJ0341777.1 hypothetical protein [Streptomyces sp. PH10-H1]
MTLTLSPTRPQAVKRIADHIADRDSYVITVPPDALTSFAHRLCDIPDWNAYLDNGTGTVLHTGHALTLLACDLIIETAAVVIVPKTVPTAVLTEAVGRDVPADGSQDIVILTGPAGRPVFWPLLLVDAIEIVDPAVAAQLRANQIHNLN